MAFDYLKRKVAEHAFNAMDNKADFLKKAGIVAILTTVICQTTAVLLNKDVPQKEKKFMFAQEVADGTINLAIFWVLTAACIKYGRNLAAGWTKDIQNDKVFEKVQDALKKEKGFGRYNIHKVKNGYVDGLGTIISLIGSVVASNFISPPIRNYAASLYQKEHMEQTFNKQPNSQNSIFDKQVPNNVFTQQKPLSQYNNMSVFLNQSKYTGNNPLRPF